MNSLEPFDYYSWLIFQLYYFVVLSDLIDDMAEKLHESLGVEEFSSLCVPSQVRIKA